MPTLMRQIEDKTPNLKSLSAEDIIDRTRVRTGETKIGERVQVINDLHNWERQVSESNSRYVLLGIPEDIGIRANFGTGGAHTAWEPALTEILNKQQHEIQDIASRFLILGFLDFECLMCASYSSVEALRATVEVIDREVSALISKIVACGKVPVVIGGGHNNAFPIIQGVAAGLKRRNEISDSVINTINLDAHTDFRPREGRHSGNGFRYAYENGYLHNYALLGYHPLNTPAKVLEEIQVNKNILAISWDELFLKGDPDWNAVISRVTDYVGDLPCGLEVDLDCISHALSSASSPCGITIREARQLVHRISAKITPAYFHICEGATRLDNGEHSTQTSKIISTLVLDFISAT